MEIASVIVDIALVLVVLVVMISGARRGFLRTVASPVKFVASVAVAFSYCRELYEKFIDNIIRVPISNQLRDFLYEKCADITPDNVTEELPTLLKMSVGIFDIDLEELASASVSSVLDEIVNSFTDPIVEIVGIIVAFILLYVAAMLLSSLVVAILDFTVSSGFLGVINRALGLIFGSAFGLIIAWGVVAVAEFAMGFVGYNFEAGAVYGFFHDLNPLDLLLSF